MKGKGSKLAVGALLVIQGAPSAFGAERDLPAVAPPGQTVTVTILLDPPPQTTVAAAEDQPPSGWTVSNISHGGSLDVSTGKVKWGLFFAPSIPSTLTYQVTVASGPSCFAGLVSYDGVDEALEGDACLQAIPAASTWSVVCLGIVLAVAGTILTQHRNAEEEGFEPP